MIYPAKAVTAVACFGTVLLLSANGAAQQTNNRLDWDPHRNTQNYVAMYATDMSPEVHDDRTVTFRLTAPDAKSVKLTGGPVLLELGADGDVPFEKGENGVWTLTVGPFKPNMYAYRLVIDGATVNDPGNTVTGTGNQPPFSILIVHGNAPAYYDAKQVPHGTVTRHIYHSDAVGGEREMFVYTPPGYTPDKKYPVLYLLGGSGEMASTWSTTGRVNFIMDNLLAEGKALPMLIAMPNNQMVHRRTPDEAEQNPPLLERDLRENIIPLIESGYSVIGTNKGRALAGLSMGGRHTQNVGFNCLDLFSSFGVLSAGAVDTEERSAAFLNDPDINEKVDYLFVGQGDFEHAERTYALRDALEKHGVDHVYYEGGGGAHDFITWRHLMYYRFLPDLWR